VALLESIPTPQLHIDGHDPFMSDLLDELLEDDTDVKPVKRSRPMPKAMPMDPRMASLIYSSVKQLVQPESEYAEMQCNIARDEDRRYAHDRVLSVFGTSTGTPRFTFRISDDRSNHPADAKRWLRLYTSAIRCSFNENDTGFVFLDWYDNSSHLVRTTLLCFNETNGICTQTLVDPSELDGIQAALEDWHLWDSNCDTVVFDKAIMTKFRDCINPYKTGDEYDQRCDEALLLLLIVWGCLRFGIRDVSVMTRTLVHLICEHRDNNEPDFIDIWNGLKEWRSRLRFKMTTPELLKLLQLDSRPLENSKCLRYTNDGKLCNNPSSESMVWCGKHQQSGSYLALDDPVLRVRMYPLPSVISDVVGDKDTFVQAVAYFESRWQASDWSCSWKTFSQQESVPNGYYDRRKRMGLVRFVGFEIEDTSITALLKRFEDNVDIHGNAFGILIVDVVLQSKENIIKQERIKILEVILPQVEVHRWNTVMVCRTAQPIFVTILIDRETRKDTFLNTINSILESTRQQPVSFFIQVGLDIDSNQGGEK
jgi:hypothetical protein